MLLLTYGVRHDGVHDTITSDPGAVMVAATECSALLLKPAHRSPCCVLHDSVCMQRCLGRQECAGHGGWFGLVWFDAASPSRIDVAMLDTRNTGVESGAPTSPPESMTRCHRKKPCSPVQVEVGQEHMYAVTHSVSLPTADRKRVSRACVSAARSPLMSTWTADYASDSQHRKGAVQDGVG